MGDLYYIVGDDIRGIWEYVQYGKQGELYANHKQLLATLMFIEHCVENYASVRFFKGGSDLEYYAMKRFCDSNLLCYVFDVSEKWLEYAEEELSSQFQME